MGSRSPRVPAHLARVRKGTRSPSCFFMSIQMFAAFFLILLLSLWEMSCEPGLDRMRPHLLVDHIVRSQNVSTVNIPFSFNLDQMLADLSSSNGTTICEREFVMIVESAMR